MEILVVVAYARGHSVTVGLNFGLSLHACPFLMVYAVKALTSLCRCAGSSETWLSAYAISTKIPWFGSWYIVAIFSFPF